MNKSIFLVGILLLAGTMYIDGQCQTPAAAASTGASTTPSSPADSAHQNKKPVLLQLFESGKGSGNLSFTQSKDTAGNASAQTPAVVDTREALEIALDKTEKFMNSENERIKAEIRKIKIRRIVFRCVSGGVLLLGGAGGFYCNLTAQQKYDEYKAIKRIGDLSGDYKPVEQFVQLRNVLYSLGAAGLAGLSISLAF
jgi:hypothetical protein